MTTIARRERHTTTIPDDDYILLRFADGLVVDPRRCPRTNHAHSHWRRLPYPVPAGEPNAECLCDETQVA